VNDDIIKLIWRMVLNAIVGTVEIVDSLPIEELKAIDAVMEKHGIRSYWRRAETLDEALSRGYPRE